LLASCLSPMRKNARTCNTNRPSLLGDVCRVARMIFFSDAASVISDHFALPPPDNVLGLLS
jgi:hypothetical protein